MSIQLNISTTQYKVPKSTKKYREVPESTEKYQKVPKSTKKYREVPKKYREVPKKYREVPKKYREVPRSTKKSRSPLVPPWYHIYQCILEGSVVKYEITAKSHVIKFTVEETNMKRTFLWCFNLVIVYKL
jgi:hypothetical protein